ncbi:MAG: hypothetical protein AAF570_17360, partial [Bacteroidota bacterium]
RTITGAPEIHSFSYAQWDGRWLFIGGRQNGLHGFLPPLAFPSSGINDAIWVVDPVANQTWSVPVDSLPDSIREPITSSNMQFQQHDSTLYMVGGYGWEQAAGTFMTFHTLTAIDIPGLVNAVMTGNHSIGPFFRQTSDPRLAICGAHLELIGNRFQLVFGHRFDGIYDREDHTGFHSQTYSYAVRSFEIDDTGGNLSIVNYSDVVDSVNFRRRDYNLVPQIFPDGTEGLTAFSGVFQEGVNLPWLFPIDIHAGGVSVVPNFDQRLANYHSAVLPLYDSTDNYMHTVFFGGEAMYYYDSLDNLVMDTLVPFVNTISRVTRGPDSSMTEYRLWSEMPALTGSNSQFIPLPGVSQYENGIIRLNPLTGRTLVWQIIGGIETPEKNISDTDPAISFASPRIFEVYVDKTNVGETPPKLVEAPATISLYPNPVRESVIFELESTDASPVQLDVLEIFGRRMAPIHDGVLPGNALRLRWNVDEYAAGVYYVRLQSGQYRKIVRMVLLPGN